MADLSKAAPKGYHTVTPGIVVRGAAKAIEFYKAAFGAEELYRMEGPDGSVVHAEIRIGDSLIMMGDEMPGMTMQSPESLKGTTASLHIYVPDTDAAFRKATAAGAKVEMPPQDMFWGDRYARVIDPFGHNWAFATRIKEMTPDEMRKAAEQAFKKP